MPRNVRCGYARSFAVLAAPVRRRGFRRVIDFCAVGIVADDKRHTGATCSGGVRFK